MLLNHDLDLVRLIERGLIVGPFFAGFSEAEIGQRRLKVSEKRTKYKKKALSRVLSSVRSAAEGST